jgi:hypothetical protein
MKGNEASQAIIRTTGTRPIDAFSDVMRSAPPERGRDRDGYGYRWVTRKGGVSGAERSGADYAGGAMELPPHDMTPTLRPLVDNQLGPVFQLSCLVESKVDVLVLSACIS